MRGLFAPLALVLGAASCASGGASRPAAGPHDVARPLAFASVEDEVLRDLAAIDRRIARRAQLVPSEDDLRRVTMAAVLREDPTVAVIDGAIDPFSFDAREHGLAAAKRRLDEVQDASVERELLGRLVDGEIVRLGEERALPRSASALVRAVVDGFAPPKTPRDAEALDRWLARRLDEVREAIATGTPALDVVRARELDDALDALERLVANPGIVAATQALVHLREALEAVESRPAAKREVDWTAIATRAAAQLGLRSDAETLAKDLDAVEIDLRRRTEDALAGSGGLGSLGRGLDASVLVIGTCSDAVSGSRIRSMAVPVELEPACHLHHLVAKASDAASRGAALAAMHDHVVVAEWSVDVARGASTIAEAESAHRLILPTMPETRARLERLALARPVAAIGAGEAARLLAAGDAAARATAWSAIGNVPLDVVRRELPVILAIGIEAVNGSGVSGAQPGRSPACASRPTVRHRSKSS